MTKAVLHIATQIDEDERRKRLRGTSVIVSLHVFSLVHSYCDLRCVCLIVNGGIKFFRLHESLKTV